MCQKNISDAESKLTRLQTEISDKEKIVIFLDDEILVQSFGLYAPRFDFASALDYKEALAQIRSTQKALIKADKAATGSTSLTYNNSLSKGQKIVRDMKKLVLRTFNIECDEIVAKVKYTNYDASLKKIYSSAESISKLSNDMGISITTEFINSKVQELRLALEYQIKKEEEKEALKEARAQEREAARLQKELDEQRKKVEKEQKHYEKALSNLQKQLKLNPQDQELLRKKEELLTELENIELSLRDIDYREANQRAGYVYVISNIGAFGENVYKIGMTRRLDPQERVDELGDASVPFNFDIHAMIFSDDAPALEAALHKAFETKKLNMVNTRREFFNVTLDEIKNVVKENFDKTVEFHDVADAEQYRISQKMKQV